MTYLTPDDVSGHALKSYFECYIPHIQVEKVDKMSAVINKVLTGMSAMFVEGDRSVLIMDTRSYPVRSPEEPSLERVVRGSRDGFTETLLTNVTLVRRRIRDPGLKFEIMQVGRRTQTDVCVVYIDDIVDKVQVDSVREKFNEWISMVFPPPINSWKKRLSTRDGIRSHSFVIRNDQMLQLLICWKDESSFS